MSAPIVSDSTDGLMTKGHLAWLKKAMTDVASALASITTLSGTVTTVQSTANAAMPKAGGAFTGGVATAVGALTDTATVAPDLAAANSYTWTIASGTARTLANPSAAVAGKGGSILITNSTGGAVTLTLGSAYKLAYAGASVPTLAAGGVYRLDYLAWSSSRLSTSITREQA